MFTNIKERKWQEFHWIFSYNAVWIYWSISSKALLWENLFQHRKMGKDPSCGAWCLKDILWNIMSPYTLWISRIKYKDLKDVLGVGCEFIFSSYKVAKQILWNMRSYNFSQRDKCECQELPTWL